MEYSSPTVGKKTAELVDEVMRGIPLSRSIYSIIKNISDTFLSENREFGKVVDGEVPAGCLCIGVPGMSIFLGGRGSDIFQALQRFRAQLA